jgi:hypothetical protein
LPERHALPMVARPTSKPDTRDAAPSDGQPARHRKVWSPPRDGAAGSTGTLYPPGAPRANPRFRSLRGSVFRTLEGAPVTKPAGSRAHHPRTRTDPPCSRRPTRRARAASRHPPAGARRPKGTRPLVSVSAAQPLPSEPSSELRHLHADVLTRRCAGHSREGWLPPSGLLSWEEICRRAGVVATHHGVETSEGEAR